MPATAPTPAVVLEAVPALVAKVVVAEEVLVAMSVLLPLEIAV